MRSQKTQYSSSRMGGKFQPLDTEINWDKETEKFTGLILRLASILHQMGITNLSQRKTQGFIYSSSVIVSAILQGFTFTIFFFQVYLAGHLLADVRL